LVVILLIVAISASLVSPAYGQDGIVLENATVTVDYGKTITFEARIRTPLPIKQASILFRGVNEEVTRVETVQVAEDGSTSFIYDASLNVLPPFGPVIFWYQATLTNDQTHTSTPVTFLYTDNRFPWREAARENVVVHWYAGDDAFGAAALDTAAAAARIINETLQSQPGDLIHAYIYSNVNDLRGALALGGEEWTAGHANPALGVVLVAIAPGPGQSIEMDSRIPHELAHVMLYRTLGDGYHRQPVWLLEGFASAMERFPNPDYAQALQIAGEGNSLIPFENLCTSFPVDAGSVFLAYAQSQSFFNYLRSAHGNSGMTRLMDIYRDGMDCDSGVTKALGASLTQLDRRWRESVLGQNATGVAARNLIPFILLMILMLALPAWGAISLMVSRRKHGQPPQ
jgi:hypothetical protein